ncbi:MAG: hypothetical protein ACK4FJ_08105 [Ferrovibrio sp.]|uniref:hypothetical protein n=1 Tax=Ferrovibrio sp. TaxID=1917215 RepID=UPI00391DC911
MIAMPRNGILLLLAFCRIVAEIEFCCDLRFDYPGRTTLQCSKIAPFPIRFWKFLEFLGFTHAAIA